MASFRLCTLLALSCVLGQATAAFTRTVSQLPKVIELEGKPFYNGSFLPTGELERYQVVVLEKILECFLLKAVAGIVISYYRASAGSGPSWYQGVRRTNELRAALEPFLADMLLVDTVVELCIMPAAELELFAESLYWELDRQKTDIVVAELYNVQDKEIKEHDFWRYLSEAKQSASLVFVHMLCKACNAVNKDMLMGLAKLAAGKFPQTTYFVKHYFAMGGEPLMFSNVSPDEWPQVLLDPGHWEPLTAGSWIHTVSWLCFLLATARFDQVAGFMKGEEFDMKGWSYVLGTVHAINKAFLFSLLRIVLERDSFVDVDLFHRIALIAIRVDPTARGFLAASAGKRGWTMPVAPKKPVSFVLNDGDETGGDVHMQPLMPFAASADSVNKDAPFAVSPSGKTVFAERLLLHIAADNVLCSGLDPEAYVYIRRFGSGTIYTYGCASSHIVRINVYHGDMIAVSWDDVCPFFLREQVDCTGQSAEDCFRRAMAFYFLSRSSVFFLAIVEKDGKEVTKGSSEAGREMAV